MGYSPTKELDEEGGVSREMLRRASPSPMGQIRFGGLSKLHYIYLAVGPDINSWPWPHTSNQYRGMLSPCQCPGAVFLNRGGILTPKKKGLYRIDHSGLNSRRMLGCLDGRKAKERKIHGKVKCMALLALLALLARPKHRFGQWVMRVNLRPVGRPTSIFTQSCLFAFCLLPFRFPEP